MDLAAVHTQCVFVYGWTVQIKLFGCSCIHSYIQRCQRLALGPHCELAVRLRPCLRRIIPRGMHAAGVERQLGRHTIRSRRHEKKHGLQNDTCGCVGATTWMDRGDVRRTEKCCFLGPFVDVHRLLIHMRLQGCKVLCQSSLRAEARCRHFVLL